MTLCRYDEVRPMRYRLLSLQSTSRVEMASRKIQLNITK